MIMIDYLFFVVYLIVFIGFGMVWINMVLIYFQQEEYDSLCFLGVVLCVWLFDVLVMFGLVVLFVVIIYFEFGVLIWLIGVVWFVVIVFWEW